ncbi:Uncharacterized protein FKW44_014134%2C partial, partial [Scomber scombrus]
ALLRFLSPTPANLGPPTASSAPPVASTLAAQPSSDVAASSAPPVASTLAAQPSSDVAASSTPPVTSTSAAKPRSDAASSAPPVTSTSAAQPRSDAAASSAPSAAPGDPADWPSPLTDTVRTELVNREESPGEHLSSLILKRLQEINIPFEDCRGQSYDNGANTKGKNKGVQARLLQLNSRAFFVPSGAHTLNLVVADAAKSSPDALGYFGHLTKLFKLFSASTHRWDVLLKYVRITLKSWAETRWESRIKSIEAVRYQAGQVREALLEVRQMTADPVVRVEDQSLAEEIGSYRFCICTAICLMWLSTGFSDAQTTTKKMCDEMNVKAELKQKLLRTTKRHFGYESPDEPIQDALRKMETTFFNVIVDTAISSLDERFQNLGELSITQTRCHTEERSESGRTFSCCADVVTETSCDRAFAAATRGGEIGATLIKALLARRRLSPVDMTPDSLGFLRRGFHGFNNGSKTRPSVRMDRSLEELTSRRLGDTSLVQPEATMLHSRPGSLLGHAAGVEVEAEDAAIRAGRTRPVVRRLPLPPTCAIQQNIQTDHKTQHMTAGRTTLEQDRNKRGNN